MYQFIWMTSLLQEKTERDYLAILEKILSRLQNARIRLKRSKSAFMLSSIDYLGQSTQEKVRAISEAPAPPNVPQLHSFLGVANYYSKFLPNLSTMLAPLYRLFQNKQSGFGILNRIKHFMKPRLT